MIMSPSTFLLRTLACIACLLTQDSCGQLPHYHFDAGQLPHSYVAVNFSAQRSGVHCMPFDTGQLRTAAALSL